MTTIPADKGNTLQLTVCQETFEDIVSQRIPDHTESRPVKTSTIGRYILKNKKRLPYLNTSFTEDNEVYKWNDYNGGNFPFLPHFYDYLHFCVGYATERDECLVKVEETTFTPTEIKAEAGKEKCLWMVNFRLGEILHLRRKGDASLPKLALAPAPKVPAALPPDSRVQEESEK